MTRWRTIALAAMLATPVACKPTWEITLDGASTATQPRFVLTRAGSTDPARITAFRVDACAARGSPPINTNWLTVAPSEPPPVAHIAYGEPPPGWGSAQGPHALTPGCYRAAVADAPPLEFDITPDGRVTARR